MSTAAQVRLTFGAHIGVLGQYLTPPQIVTVANEMGPELGPTPADANYPVTELLMQQIVMNHPAWFTKGGMVSDDLLTQQNAAVATATAQYAAATAATGNWFTDPTQAVIAGVPNFAIVAAAALALLLLMKKK